MTTILVRARYLGPTNTRGSRVSVQSDNDQGVHRINPINYGWRTDNVWREAVAEALGVHTRNVEYGMELAGWKIYTVSLP